MDWEWVSTAGKLSLAEDTDCVKVMISKRTNKISVDFAILDR